MRHDLRELFTGEELRGLMWRDNNLQVMVDALRQGMEAGDVRQMSPELLAEQFWGAMMHAMGYLHRKKKSLRADGHDMEQIKALLTDEIEAATESCVSMLRP